MGARVVWFETKTTEAPENGEFLNKIFKTKYIQKEWTIQIISNVCDQQYLFLILYYFGSGFTLNQQSTTRVKLDFIDFNLYKLPRDFTITKVFTS